MIRDPSTLGSWDPPPGSFWCEVEALVAGARSLDDLRAHRLHLLAPWAWQRAGRHIPTRLYDEQRIGGIVQLAAIAVLHRIRVATQEPMAIFKGAEVAARYPDPNWRPFNDIDLLAADPDAVQRALIDAGFVELGSNDDYEELHHLPPLALPGLSILVEVHRRPTWPEWLPEPDVDELVGRAVGSLTGVSGVMAVEPADHALLVAAHAWEDGPVTRTRDLIDIWILAEEAGRAEVARRAEALGVERLWLTSINLADAIFSRTSAASVPLWARPLAMARDVTVLEHHVQRWIVPFWIMPRRRAVLAAVTNFARDVLPAGGGEPWSKKLARSRRAMRNAFRPRLHHRQELGDEGRRPPRRKRY